MSSASPAGESVPFADRRFFEIFLPRELALVQQRALEQNGAVAGDERFLLFVLLRLAPAEGTTPGREDTETPAVGRHLRQLLTSAIRPCDIAGRLGPHDYLAVVRELDLERGHTIAERLVALVRHSRLLTAGGLGVSVGYVAYPLSPQPDLRPQEWSALVELARRLATHAGGRECGGWGLVRGPQMGAPTIPEIDVVSLAMTDLDALLNADLLRIRALGLAFTAEPGG